MCVLEKERGQGKENKKRKKLPMPGIVINSGLNKYKQDSCQGEI